MQQNVVMVTNHKGGVGKTSITTNLAALVAQAGWKVAVVDLDPQGNATARFAVEGDDGRNLFDAVRDRDVLKPVTVRPNLDLIAGGTEWRDAVVLINQAGDDKLLGLDRAISHIASGYNLVLLDTPPGDLVIQRLALASTRFMLLPTRIDPDSTEGLAKSFAFALAERERLKNPTLAALGVVVLGTTQQATAMRKYVRGSLEDALGQVPVFDTVIRNSELAAAWAAYKERPVHEAAEHAAELTKTSPWYKKIGRKEHVAMPDASPDTLLKLAGDYNALAIEFMRRFTKASTASAVA